MPWMWALLRLPRFRGASHADEGVNIAGRMTAGAFAGWGLHPLESAAFARRTPGADIGSTRMERKLVHETLVSRFDLFFVGSDACLYLGGLFQVELRTARLALG